MERPADLLECNQVFLVDLKLFGYWDSPEKRLYNDLVNEWFLVLYSLWQNKSNNGIGSSLKHKSKKTSTDTLVQEIFITSKCANNPIIFLAPKEHPLSSIVEHYCCVSYLQDDCVERWSTIWNWFLWWHSWIWFLWTC